MAIIETPHDIRLTNANIAIWHITEPESELTRLCQAKGIDASITQGVKLEKRRIEMLCEHLLIEHLTSHVCYLQHTSTGAPWLPSQISKTISISHTNHYVIVAISPERIGIDIESYSPKVLRVRDKFLSEAEKCAFPDGDIVKNVTAWTAKEAMYKAINVPGIDLSHQIAIDASAIASGSNKYLCHYGQRMFATRSHQAEDYAVSIVTEYK